MRRPIYIYALLHALSIAFLGAQVIQPPYPPQPNAQPATDAAQLRPTYILGPNDQMLIRARDVDEINEKTFRIDQDGSLTLPLLGSIKAAGVTVQQLEKDLVEKLKTLVLNPDVKIVVTQYHVDPVFFLGAFQKPGIYPLDGRQTLVDMMIRVGGLQPNASRYIRLTRKQEAGPIPLAGAVQDQGSKVSTVDISLGSLTNTVNPAEDLVLLPNDVVTASKAERVYVQGAFSKAGVVDMEERESLSVMQVITMAGGLQPDADTSKAVVLRPVLATSRRAMIPIDLRQIMATKANDFPLLPNDILYVPLRKSKLKTAAKVSLVLMPILTSVLLYAVLR